MPNEVHVNPQLRQPEYQKLHRPVNCDICCFCRSIEGVSVVIADCDKDHGISTGDECLRPSDVDIASIDSHHRIGRRASLHAEPHGRLSSGRSPCSPAVVAHADEHSFRFFGPRNIHIGSDITHG